MPKIQITHDCFIITILITIVLTALSLVLLSKFVEGEVIVDTQLSAVRRSLIKNGLENTVYALQHLHHAKSPFGLIRFEDSVPVNSWQNSLSATDRSSTYLQDKGLLATETCFSLNVYIKRLKNDTVKLPIILFRQATPSEESYLYDPCYLLDEEADFSPVHYQLESEEFLSAGDEFALGNACHTNQMDVLLFIQRHKYSFSDNLDSVTLTAQDAGTGSIVLKTFSKMPCGLLHSVLGVGNTLLTLIPPRKEKLFLVKI